MRLRSKAMVTGVTVMALAGATVGVIAASGSGATALSAVPVVEEAGPHGRAFERAFEQGGRGFVGGGPGAFPLGEGGPEGRTGGPLEIVTTLLGMEPEAFVERLRAGETPVQIAASVGVDEATLVDAVVSEITAHATERVTEWANNVHEPGQRHHGPRGADRGGEVLAALFGITVEELHELVEPGTTMADIAAGFGFSADDVVAALVAEVDAHLQERVDAGDLTVEEKAERLAEITARITERVNRPFGEGPQGPPPPAAEASLAA